jgi:ABC-type amino acid transport substrate-binding protein
VRRGFFIYLASGLLLVAAAIDGWDWLSMHDVEILSLFQRAPIVGGSVRAVLGEDTWKEQVTLAVDASYPPFASVDPDGKMVGFEVDLAAELGRRLSAKPVLVNMDAGDALFDALASRRVDAIIAGLTYYPEVTRDVAYSDSYFEAGPVLLASASRGGISGPRDLAGRRLMVEMGSQGEEEARRLQRELTGLLVVPVDDVERILTAVGDGSADATILDRPAIPPGGLAAHGLAPVGAPLRSQPYVVAVQRKNRSLLLAINRELDAMKSDGTLAAIEGRWFK